MTFEEQLAFGKIGESDIARWLKSRGSSVLPVYEKEIDEGKGPQFFADGESYAAPDLFCFPQCEWIEAKHKTVFSWHRITQTWQTGIDMNHWTQYQRVEEISKRRVWLMFLHRCARPDQRDLMAGCPPQCPTGLFVGSLKYLARNVDHTDGRWGRHGMIYWRESTLNKVAEIDDVLTPEKE